MKYLSSQRGYTLLFAVLTATLVLGVATFILSVSRKQFLLAGTARESTYSIYAADSGIECAAAISGSISTTSGSVTIPCNGTSPSGTFVQAAAGSLSSLGFKDPVYQASSIPISLFNGNCALITVTDGYQAVGGGHETIIDSRGYNTCVIKAGVLGPDTSNPSTVERALRLTYH